MMNLQASSPEFLSVLTSALNLPAGEQQRLAEVMARVTGAAPTTGAARLVEAASAELDAPNQVVGEWLQSISFEPLWTQLQLIEEVLDAMHQDDPERPLLLAARSALLEGNLPLAMRRGVHAAAVQHPVGAVVGLCGLLLALVALVNQLGGWVF